MHGYVIFGAYIGIPLGYIRIRQVFWTLSPQSWRIKLANETEMETAVIWGLYLRR